MARKKKVVRDEVEDLLATWEDPKLGLLEKLRATFKLFERIAKKRGKKK